MGFLNSNTQVVDAILTRYGRDKLATGGTLGISRFALSDDGVDYDLWNVKHPSGSTSFGEAIENMPVLEAFPDEDVLLSYKLMHGPRNRERNQVIYFTEAEKIIQPGETVIVEPRMANANSSRFLFKIQDARYATFVETASRTDRRSRRQYPSNVVETMWAGGKSGLPAVKIQGIHKQDTNNVKLTVYSVDKYTFATINLKIVGKEDSKYNTYFTTGDR